MVSLSHWGMFEIEPYWLRAQARAAQIDPKQVLAGNALFQTLRKSNQGA